MKLRLNFQMVVYFSCSPFRKPEWDLKNDTIQKKKKKSHIGNMAQSYCQF